MTKTNWTITAKRGDWNGLGAKFKIDPLIAKLMINRGITDEAGFSSYLNADAENLSDPALLADGIRAVGIIEEAIERREKVVIASDYDVDGIFSGQILFEGLRELGLDPTILTPNRVTEGYGLNRRIVDEAAAMGAGLIMTCDNGIAASAEIEYAKSLGMRIIVTDHHEVPFTEEKGDIICRLPDADAVVDPHRADCGYPYKELCGAGVALRVMQLLYNRAGKKLPEVFYQYAAIATIADVMELTGENRIIVKEGLRRINGTSHVGLSAMIGAVGLNDKDIAAYHIGFVIGPCFNAAGRLETAAKAQRLLITKDEHEAREIAEHLKSLNDSRKTMTEDGTRQAIELIEGTDIINDRIMLVRLHDCHESITGIIAGRIKERYNRPVFIFTDASDGIKGSGRSIEAYHMFRGLVSCSELLERFGGHAMAAGLSLKEDNLEALRAKLNAESGLTDADLIPTIRIDSLLPFEYITERLVSQLSLLEPTGRENTVPIFAERTVFIKKAVVIGRNSNILKLRLANEKGSVIDGILFNDIDGFTDEISEVFGSSAWNAALRGQENNIELSIAYYPNINDYMGVRTKQAIIRHYLVRGKNK